MSDDDPRPLSGNLEGDEYRFKFARALFAFLVLPGMVAFVIPLWMAPRHPGADKLHWLGLPVLLTGIFVLLWCVRDFYVAGKGTLAPWSPPRKLVTVGLYRLSRNPMYIGVLAIVAGWSLWFMSRGLLMYEAILLIGFHLRVISFEEPWAAQTFGDEWSAYKARVRRWL
ncbi:MAG: isoprenylcysteine carboxylmethyltransferase family protein [Gemmatimonadales bacterium]